MDSEGGHGESRPLRELVRAARDGEYGALEALRVAIAPAAAEVGVAAPEALGAWLRLSGSGVVPRLEAMRAALAPRNALEELLVERVVLTWLALDVCETLYAGVLGREHGIREADYAQWRVDAAHKRYLGSLGALYRVQRLKVAGDL